MRKFAVGDCVYWGQWGVVNIPPGTSKCYAIITDVYGTDVSYYAFAILGNNNSIPEAYNMPIQDLGKCDWISGNYFDSFAWHVKDENFIDIMRKKYLEYQLNEIIEK